MFWGTLILLVMQIPSNFKMLRNWRQRLAILDDVVQRLASLDDVVVRGATGACWLLLFCFSYSHTGGVGNSSSNSSGPGIPSSLPSSVPLQPSAPPQINVIAATPNVEKKQARVLYDYDAADSSELTLLADEVSLTRGFNPYSLLFTSNFFF